MRPALERYRRAWRLLEDIVGTVVETAAWDRPSPCGDWTARQLAGHLVDGHRQVQAMLEDAAALPPVTDPAGLAELAGDDPAARLRAAAARVEASVARVDPTSVVSTPRGPLPVEQLLAVAVIEPFVHGWDLAVATGQRITLDPDLVATLLPGVQQLGGQLAASGMYAPALPVPERAPDAERLLAALGRRAG